MNREENMSDSKTLLSQSQEYGSPIDEDVEMSDVSEHAPQQQQQPPLPPPPEDQEQQNQMEQDDPNGMKKKFFHTFLCFKFCARKPMNEKLD